MSDLFGNHIVGFPTRRLISSICFWNKDVPRINSHFFFFFFFIRFVYVLKLHKTFEPPRGKTNNVVSEQVRLKPACTVTEKS